MPTILSLGPAEEMADGQCRTVTGPGKAISVFRVGDQFYAIDDMCPHAGASLGAGHVEDGVVTCPWHFWRFRLCDGAWADNPRIKIGSYPVQVVDGEVRLEIPDPPEPPAPKTPLPTVPDPLS
jgi:nitrite reductase (NADH) small subunit/3-phenylpropionate/trans-cinnamate dioxygenase ferredoxin subunit